MIERLEAMPPGTIGFRAAGKLTQADYRDVLEPALRDAVAQGGIRLLFQITDFQGLEPAAWWDDVKTGFGLGIGHRSAWKKWAIVTDIDWIAKAFQFFDWATPGETRVFGLDQLDQARSWLVS